MMSLKLGERRHFLEEKGKRVDNIKMRLRKISYEETTCKKKKNDRI
jgi:hypothetical protein